MAINVVNINIVEWNWPSIHYKYHDPHENNFHVYWGSWYYECYTNFIQ